MGGASGATLVEAAQNYGQSFHDVYEPRAKVYAPPARRGVDEGLQLVDLEVQVLH